MSDRMKVDIWLLKNQKGNLVMPFMIVVAVAIVVAWIIEFILSILIPQSQYFSLPIVLVIAFIFTIILMRTW